jgi:GAF domain-containing protein/HAMP domain-containing protein
MTNSPSAPKPQNDQSKFSGRLARTMILALLAFAMIPLSIMASVAYTRSRTLLKEQIANQLKTTIQNQVEQINREMRTKAVRLDYISRRPGFHIPAEAVLSRQKTDPFYRSLVTKAFKEVNQPGDTPLFDDFALVDTEGKIWVSSQLKWEGQSIGGTSYFMNIVSGELSFASYNFVPILLDEFGIITVSPFYGSNGQVRGYLLGVSRQKSSQAILTAITVFNPDSSAYFYTSIGHQFVGIDPHENILSAFIPSSSQRTSIAATFESDNNTNFMSSPLSEFTNAAGTDVIAYTDWIPALNVGVVVELPQSAVFGQLNSLAPFTALLLVLTFIAMAIVIWISINRLVRPILGLAETTRRFSEGDWQERSPIKRKDELGLLAYSFNKMADELSSLYRTLEARIEERTRQIRTAAEVAQSITSNFNLDELLDNTVKLIVERFGYYHAGIFLVDRTGRTANLHAAFGPAAQEMLSRGHKLEVGSPSIIGWVTANNQPRVASDVEDDPIHLKNELMPETQAEVGIPISSGNLILGALDVQSTTSKAFDPDTIVVLQTLANQIAAALQNIGQTEATQVNYQDMERLYRASYQIAEAKTEEEVLETTARVLKDTPYITAVLTVNDRGLEVVSISDPFLGENAKSNPTKFIEFPVHEIATQLLHGSQIYDLTAQSELPAPLSKSFKQMGCQVTALLPIARDEILYAILAFGAPQKHLITPPIIQPYANIANIVSVTLEKVLASSTMEKRLGELGAIASTSQAISSVATLPSLYAILHEQIRQTVGDYSLVVAEYDEETDTVRIPYMYEDGQVSSLEPFPLGEGLSSILIRTRQPLMLVEDTERRAIALGAKVVGKPAKSWMGAPLLVGGESIGAIILQDLEHEKQFTEDDLRFLTAIAGQVGGAIYNIRLLNEARQHALRLETAAEIARDISGSLNLDELLLRTVNLITGRFEHYYHAAIFLVDPLGEFAVIREATGEAGAQMKRANHKLGVGSKSIVGYVAGRGEPLVVNDTAKDVLHQVNPLLPNTQAEAAIPLKLGERILGVIDVQSTQPNVFQEEDLQTLRILADQLAIAVVNTELFAETQEHLSQHRLLHHVTTSAASGTTLEEALDSAVQGLQVTLGGDRVAILLADKDNKVLEIKAAIGYSEEDISEIRIPIGTGITGWAAAHRKPLRIDNVADDPRYIQVSSNTRSELAIPLTYRNDLLGVINVESEQLGAYNEHDEEILGTLGGSLAAIIANARLLEQIRKQAERERLLFEVTSKIRRSTDMQTILSTTANELSKAVGGKRTQIKVELKGNGETELMDKEDSHKVNTNEQ